VVGVGTEANASRKLVSVCSEYKYWGTLVAEVEPDARPAAAFDLSEAESSCVFGPTQIRCLCLLQLYPTVVILRRSDKDRRRISTST
jgi:hypothetical protein